MKNPTHFVRLKECLNVWRRVLREHEVVVLLSVVGTVESRRAVRHHSEDGEIVAGLIAFSASFVFVIDDIFADVAINVFVTGR